MSVVTEMVQVAVPVRTAYDQWTQFESFPRFMSRVGKVTQERPTLTHWTIRVGPLRRGFHAEVLEQHPDAHVSWRSLDRHLQHHGSVTFQSLALGRTTVTVRLHLVGWRGLGVPAPLRAVVRRMVRAELGRFQEYVEGVGDAGETWRGTIHDGRVLQLQKEPPDTPGWPHG